MVHRFLHLSDIHFGQEKNGKLVKHDYIRNALLNDAETLTKERGAISRILITGDIAYSGKTNEYKTANQWLEKLTKICGCDETHVSTIPGNHDCDLDAISNQAKMIYAQIRLSKQPELAQAYLDGIIQDGEAANPFLPKLHNYREFASGYDCDFESQSRPFWVRYFELPGGIKLRLIGFTSVQVSDKDDKIGKMILGNTQYTISEDANIVNVVLSHHPLDWFIDKIDALQYIHNNVRVIIVGHEHNLNIQKTVDGFTKKEWLMIYAGATTPPDQPYDYTYNWLEFSCKENNGQQQLVVEIFPRVWVQQKVRFDADYRRLDGPLKSTKIEISCPNLHPMSEQITVCTDQLTQTSVTTAPKEETSTIPPTSSNTQAELIPQGGGNMNTYNIGFDRLRYLFWRYLDWRQRLKVLVDVDALPETADQPLPQTLERQALEAARKAGKLYALWDAIMPLIPAEKRGDNPFLSSDR